MSTAGGKGFPECDTCVNADLDPFQCRTCKNGSNWEAFGDLDPDIDAIDDYDDINDFRTSEGGFE